MKQTPRICGFVMVLGFFLPFIVAGPISCSGLQLVQLGFSADAEKSKSGEGEMDMEGAMMKGMMEGMTKDMPTLGLKLLALIPLVGLISGIVNKKPMHIASGAIVSLMFFYYIAVTQGGIFKGLGIGAYLCAAAAMAQIFTGTKMSAAVAEGDGEMDVGGGEPPEAKEPPSGNEEN